MNFLSVANHLFMSRALLYGFVTFPILDQTMQTWCHWKGRVWYNNSLVRQKSEWSLNHRIKSVWSLSHDCSMKCLAWLGKFCTCHAAIFQLQAFTYGDSYLPAPTSETKKIINEACRIYGKLQLPCSEFFRAAIGSTRKQLRTCVHQLFDEMCPQPWQKYVCCLVF